MPLIQTYIDHTLSPLKGWPSPHAIDFHALPSPNVLYNLRPGQCVHLNSAGQFEPGCQLAQMPLFLFNGVLSNDANTGGLQGGGAGWAPISPSGALIAFPAKAPLELETTEYLQTLTYNINDLLRSPVGNASTNDTDLVVTGKPTTTSSGVLRNDSVTLYTTAVVGRVSRVPYLNANSRNVIAFWPESLPGTV